MPRHFNLCDNDTMDSQTTIPPELKARIEALTARSSLDEQEIIREALENGRSLAWQEEWLRRIDASTEAADRGEFATAERVDQVLNKYRPT